METHVEEATAVDIDKLLSLLEASKKAAHLIAGKHLLLLIGRTGAGKVSLLLHQLSFDIGYFDDTHIFIVFGCFLLILFFRQPHCCILLEQNLRL